MRAAILILLLVVSCKKSEPKPPPPSSADAATTASLVIRFGDAKKQISRTDYPALIGGSGVNDWRPIADVLLRVHPGKTFSAAELVEPGGARHQRTRDQLTNCQMKLNGKGEFRFHQCLDGDSRKPIFSEIHLR
jgi:hypothetical protein